MKHVCSVPTLKSAAGIMQCVKTPVSGSTAVSSVLVSIQSVLFVSCLSELDVTQFSLFNLSLSYSKVRNYSIFHNKSTQQLFAYAELDDEESFARVAKSDDCAIWWKYFEDWGGMFFKRISIVIAHSEEKQRES